VNIFDAANLDTTDTHISCEIKIHSTACKHD